MGLYRFKDGTTVDTTGIIRTADNAQLPPDPSSRDWQDYLAWKAVPNTPDAATALSVPDAKKAKKKAIDEAAQVEFAKDVRVQSGGAPSMALWNAVMIGELHRYELEVALSRTPSAANYPVMNALIGVEGGDLDTVATNLRTWFDGVKSRFGSVGSVGWAAHKSVNSQSTVSGVNGVTPSWPGGGAGE